MNQTFPKILIAGILIVFVVGGVFAWQYFGAPKEIKSPEKVLQDETANWQTYRNEEYGFEVKYPADWNYVKNIFSFDPSLVFCPLTLTDPDPEVVCKLKTGAAKPQYEEGMIYLFAYNNDEKPNNPNYYSLGFANGKYYYLYSEDNELIVNHMLSTFRFIEQDETVGWKTYHSDKYNFGFKYPPTFNLSFIPENITGVGFQELFFELLDERRGCYIGMSKEIGLEGTPSTNQKIKFSGGDVTLIYWGIGGKNNPSMVSTRIPQPPNLPIYLSTSFILHPTGSSLIGYREHIRSAVKMLDRSCTIDFEEIISTLSIGM